MRLLLISALGLALLAGCSKSGEQTEESDMDLGTAAQAVVLPPTLPPPPQGSTCVLIQRGTLGQVSDTDISLGNGTWATGAYPFTWTGPSPYDHWSVYRFDLGVIPQGSQVVLAEFTNYVSWNQDSATVRAHRVLADWNEATATWQSFGGAASWDPTVLASFDAIGSGYKTIDVTPLAQGWFTGQYPNFGLLLEEDPVKLHNYLSSEAGTVANRPSLYVCYVTGPCGGKANGDACDDGNACTLGETCQNGVCSNGTVKTCALPDQCHSQGTCDPATGVCSNPAKPDGSACNDGNSCTQVDTCQSGTCTGTDLVVCAALDACHDPGTCDSSTGVCSNPAKPDGTACNDDNACTQVDTCQSGTCTGASPVVCVPAAQCQEPGVCDPANGLCSFANKPDGTACNDGNACTQVDTCQSGACSGASPVVCTALDQCHDPGVCDTATGACSNPAKADGTACSDGNACTQVDTCQSGSCTGTSPVVCTALDQCHDPGVCDAATGACSNPAKADGTACNDANACTQVDTCQSGSCAGTSPVVCTALDQCHVPGVCDVATGTCSNPPKADGTPCNDGNACTTSDACGSGTCAGGPPPDCDDGNVCTTDGCSPATGCTHTNNTSPCDDLDACTTNDTCSGGLCFGGPAASCDDGNPCTTDACNNQTGCYSAALVDGSPCPGGLCQGGNCNLGPACPSTCCQGHGQPGCSDQAIANCVCAQEPSCCTDQWSAACAALVTSLGCGTCSDPCDDNDVCTADLCSVAGCAHQAVSCSDGVACTADSCAPGTGCQHVVACPPGQPCSSNFCASALGQSPAWAWLCQ